VSGPGKRSPGWLEPALDYLRDWLAFQVERGRQPGCAVAVSCDQRIVFDEAFGHADVATRKPLKPRHRFRIASHSKAFTAAAILLLREQGKVGLDDPAGRYVDGLHPSAADARIGDLLSHAAGITRDGVDSGQFNDRRPFLSREEVLEDLRRPQPLEAGVQLKYSNHGFALLGLVIETITGSGYLDWMQRHVVDAAGLTETTPDVTPRAAARLPSGHTAEHPYGQRLRIPGDNPCNAIAAAGGFVSTAADTARFFAQLDPSARNSILSPASRRLMAQRRLRDECNPADIAYGYGLMMGGAGAKEWIGHAGSLQGFVSRTARFVVDGWTITVLCNAIDGLPWQWVDGAHGILSHFKRHGAPARQSAAWRGRWWNLWGALDLVPAGTAVFQVNPALYNPFDGANAEIELAGKDRGRVRRASAFASPGEDVRLVRGADGKARELWAGGALLVPQAAQVARLRKLYGKQRG
jgi:D-alanyl-D-alanine carboxypeptidase